jgi:hypothetical protein
VKKGASELAHERTMQRVFLGGEEPADISIYEEYVRGFDEIPILDDAVRIPPRPPTAPSFVRGERRSLRKEERADGYSLREASRTELEDLYQEYLHPKPLRRKRKTAATKKPSRRKNRRPARATG